MVTCICINGMITKIHDCRGQMISFKKKALSLKKTNTTVMEIIQLNCVDVYNKLYGLHTKHPLVSVVDLTKSTSCVNHVKMNYGIYALFLKNGVNCTLKYGRQNYDYQEGTIVSFAPGQVVEVEMAEAESQPEVYGLLFHPDLIYGTPLAQKMNRYNFFNYAQNEALHLSEQERAIISDCLQKIDYELSYPVDKHSRSLLCTYIELILDYCLRFYDRQFCTREKVNSDILVRFEELLNDYFSSEECLRKGFPSVRYFADAVCLSPGYFGDLIKRETGKTAQDCIQQKIIDLSKKHLLGKQMNVSEIAYSLGFQYPQHFIRLFKKQEGCTPGEFRKKILD